jgi:predicted 3-demethylubiquinone-9 3-methyltransferase (glyoxalase superfamily)
MQKMTPFLWYDGNVAEAMELYRSVFPGSKVLSTTPGPNGSRMSATFELDGQRFMPRASPWAADVPVPFNELRDALTD